MSDFETARAKAIALLQNTELTEAEKRESERRVEEVKVAFIDSQRPPVWQEDRLRTGRDRAMRANMMKALNKNFADYETFTVAEAAIRTGQKAERIKAYLEKETLMPGAPVVRQEDGVYMLINPFI